MIGIITYVGIVLFENEDAARATLGPNLQGHSLLLAVGPASPLVNEVVNEVLLSASPVKNDEIAQRVITNDGSEEEVYRVIEILDILVPNEDKMSNAELARWLLKQHKGNRIAAINDLRLKRRLGLKDAHDLVPQTTN